MQLYVLEGTREAGKFVPYGDGAFQGHSGSINDIAWAPLAGRSFHMIVTSGSDQRIIVHKMIVKDLLSDEPAKPAEPHVTRMFVINPII